MARTSATASITGLCAQDLRFQAGAVDPDTAYFYLDRGTVWIALTRHDPAEAAEQADAMARLVELGRQAEAWLRGGDLPQQDGQVTQ